MRSLLNLLSMRRTITDRGNAMRTHKRIVRHSRHDDANYARFPASAGH
jgi:hypothetical protein